MQAVAKQDLAKMAANLSSGTQDVAKQQAANQEPPRKTPS